MLENVTYADLFEMTKSGDTLKNKYQILKFYQSNSPLTLFSNPISTINIEIEESDMAKTNLCWYKWTKVNANKTLYTEIQDLIPNFF